MAKPSSKRRGKFRVGQVVADCFDFFDGRGEFIKDYFRLSKDLAAMYNRDNGIAHVTYNYKHYVRAQTARERGPVTAGKG